MTRTLALRVLVPFVFFGFGAVSARAFTECTQAADVATGGHWPNPRNTAHFGTQKWEFDWRVVYPGGLEISNVRYTSDLSQPKKLVIKRASLPFLPVHYPDNAQTCGGDPHGYNDQIGGMLEPICCAHVPTTPCNVDPRTMPCNPPVRPAAEHESDCAGGTSFCTGVCEGTQIDISLPIEDGVGERVSGAADADVVLTVNFRLGGYQFIQRWRFRDNGTLIPSIRAGGIHNCQFHNHQIYWRFNFQLAATANESVQEC